MSAQVFSFETPVVKPLTCSFCKKSLPKGSLALHSVDGDKHMCEACIKHAAKRMNEEPHVENN